MHSSLKGWWAFEVLIWAWLLKQAFLRSSQCFNVVNSWHLQYNINMNSEFETSFKRKAQRQRFYSSMNYDQYCDIYGPPAPLFKPQEDPIDDLPLLDLEQPPATSSQPEQPEQTDISRPAVRLSKMDTILEIDGSQNFTQNFHRSPQIDPFSTAKKSRELTTIGEEEAPKRMRVRMRSQSDNSEYLIFNFLERHAQKGRKKVKFD